MDKKSFFRGFGTGILFASVILGVSFSVRTSESAIISRATKLGMAFDSNNGKVLSDTTPSPTEEPSGVPGFTAVPGGSKETENSKSTEPAVSGNPESSTKPAADKKPAASKVPASQGVQTTPTEKDKIDNDKEFDDAEKKAEGEMENIRKQLTINDGDWASKVSRELEEMGIIDNAADFDDYLSENGYSVIIHSGTYDVSPGDTYKELADKITLNYKNRH